jgi:hypothetical protein
MEFFVPSPIALGAIVAAGIAGAFSVLSLVVTKEQKVSEFRRSWLEDLRGELASLLAHANLFAALYERTSDAAPPGEGLVALKAEILGMNQAAAQIRLRLRDDDRCSAALLADVDAIKRLIDRVGTFETAAFSAVQSHLVANARCLMRLEWRRVKRGEFIFRFAKLTAFLVTLEIAAVAAFFLLA